MPIRVACPMCGRSGRVPDHAIGKVAQCPACGNRRKLTRADIIPEDIELLDPNRPMGIEGLEILDEDSRPSARPAPRAPAQSRREPVRRPAPLPRPNGPPTPVAAAATDDGPAINPMFAGLAVGLGFVALAALLVGLGRPRAGRDRPDEPHVRKALASLDREREAPGGPGASTGDPPKASPEGPANVSAESRANEVASRPAVAEPSSSTAATAPGPASMSPGVALSTAEIVARSEPSVALVKGKAGSGTGFLVAPGVLATNSHVIDGEFIGGLEVRFPSADAGRKGPFPAELLYEDTKRDLAFLAVQTNLPALVVAPSYRYRKGEDVTVIGNPGVDGDTVLENAICRGVMSTKAELDGQAFYQLGIAVNPGNSGGPVFDQSGQVIGVVTLRIPGKEELSFCIPVEELRAAIVKVRGLSRPAMAELRTRHRMRTTFKSLSRAGALYGFALELHVAARSNPRDKELAEKTRELDEGLGELKNSILATLDVEAGSTRDDMGVPAATRRKVGEMVDSYKRLRDAFERGQASTPVDSIRSMKSGHRRLVVDLGATLGEEIPKGLLELLDDHLVSVSNPGMALNVPQPFMGGSLRERMLPPIPRPPGFGRPSGFGLPPGFGRPPGFPGRLGPRGRIGP